MLIPDTELLKLSLVVRLEDGGDCRHEGTISTLLRCRINAALALLTDVLPLSIVPLEDGVLGRHVLQFEERRNARTTCSVSKDHWWVQSETHQRQLLLNGHLERSVSKVADGLLSVVHGETHSRSIKVEHFQVGRLGTLVVRGVHELELASSRNDDVGSTVLYK